MPASASSTLWAYQTTGFNSAAAVAFIWFDILIAFDQEVDRIWRQPCNYRMKWLYLFIRYSAAISETLIFLQGEQIIGRPPYTRVECISYFLERTVLMYVVLAAVQLILALRVKALYARIRWIGRALLGMLAASFIITILGVALVFRFIRFDHYCHASYTGNVLPYFIMMLLLPALLSMVLFVLTTCHFIAALRTGWGCTPLVKLLTLDGAWAFVLACTCMLANFVLSVAVHGVISAVAYNWFLPVMSVVGARLILNLQEYSIDAHSATHSADSDPGLQSSIIVVPFDNTSITSYELSGVP